MQLDGTRWLHMLGRGWKKGWGGGWKYQAEKHRQTVKKSYEYHVLSLQSIRATFRRDIFYWVIVVVETINRISGFRRHEWSMQKHERNHKEDYQCEVNTFGQPAVFRRSHFFEDFSSAVPKSLKDFVWTVSTYGGCAISVEFYIFLDTVYLRLCVPFNYFV